MSYFFEIVYKLYMKRRECRRRHALIKAQKYFRYLLINLSFYTGPRAQSEIYKGESEARLLRELLLSDRKAKRFS